MPYYGGTPMAANPDALMARLMANGLTRAQAAAMVGNLQRESSLISNNVNQGEGAYGLMQWRGSRFQDLQDFAAKQGKVWTDPNVQADFAVHEMRAGNERKAGAAFLGATDLAGANQALRGVIRYEDKPGETEARGTNAQRAFDSTAGAKGPATVQTPQPQQVSRETLAQAYADPRPQPKGIRGGLAALGHDIGGVIEKKGMGGFASMPGMGGILGMLGQQARPPAPGSPESVSGFRGLFGSGSALAQPGAASYLDPNTGSQMATGLPGRYEMGDVLNLGRPPVAPSGQAQRPAVPLPRPRPEGAPAPYVQDPTSANTSIADLLNPFEDRGLG